MGSRIFVCQELYCSAYLAVCQEFSISGSLRFLRYGRMERGCLAASRHPSCWWQAPLVLVADTPCAEGSHACPVTVRLQNKAGWRLAPGGEAGHKRRDKGRRKVPRFSYIALYPAVNKLFADPAAVSCSLLRLLCRERPLFVFIWLDIRFRLVLCR